MATETLDVTSMLPNQFQPKSSNQWIMMIEGLDAFVLKTATRPKMKTEEVPIPWMNSTRYVAGKTTFEPAEVTLFDPVAPSAAQQVMEWVRLCFEVVSGRAGYADFYKRDIQLKLVDPVGTVVELWDVKGAFLTDIDFGELTYEEQKPLEIKLTIRYDVAVLQF
jgi:hypothetical protein